VGAHRPGKAAAAQRRAGRHGGRAGQQAGRGHRRRARPRDHRQRPHAGHAVAGRVVDVHQRLAVRGRQERKRSRRRRGAHARPALRAGDAGSGAPTRGPGRGGGARRARAHLGWQGVQSPTHAHRLAPRVAWRRGPPLPWARPALLCSSRWCALPRCARRQRASSWRAALRGARLSKKLNCLSSKTAAAKHSTHRNTR